MKKGWVATGLIIAFTLSATLMAYYQTKKTGNRQNAEYASEFMRFSPFPSAQSSEEPAESRLFNRMDFNENWVREALNKHEKGYAQMKYIPLQIPVFPQDYEIRLKETDDVKAAGNLENISGPRFSPDGKELIFYAGLPGKRSIYRVGIHSEGIQQLTSNQFDSLDPDWLPDGERIVYSNNKTGNYEIWLMDKQGKKQKMISRKDGAKKTHPRSSPIPWVNYAQGYEGVKGTDERTSLILFERQDEKGVGLWAMGESGRLPFNVTKDLQSMAKFSNAEWSPTGTNIYYNAQTADGVRVCQGWYFGRGDLPGYQPKLPEIQLGGPAYYPQLTPNQTKICFMREREDDRLLYSAVDGSHIREIKFKNKIKGPIAWSADGFKIAYVQAGGTTGGLVVQKVLYPLQDVLNLWQYPVLKTNQLGKIQQNHFVVTGEENRLFHTVYETGGYHGEFGYQIPSFITTDSTLELFHLFFDYTLKNLEQDKLAPMLKAFVDGLLERIGQELQRPELKPEIRSGMEVWRQYMKVAQTLLLLGLKSTDETQEKNDETMRHEESSAAVDIAIDAKEIEAIDDPVIQKEVRLIVDPPAQGTNSPVLKQIVDYSQFIVRGHYTENRTLAAYFRTLMWLSKGFQLKDPEQKLQALMLVVLFENNPNLVNLWEKIYSPILHFVGGAEDITIPQAIKLAKESAGINDINFCLKSEAMDRFCKALDKFPAPEIAPFEGRQFRVFPQRFTPDSYIHQSLVYSALPADPKTLEVRKLPNGLDIMAVFGSDRAFQILDSILHETHYYHYSERIKELKERFIRVGISKWQQNLYWGWLYTLISLTLPVDTAVPPFMRTQAWLDKSLNTALASWAELRHDTLLYVKQCIAEGGEGAEGWEPVLPIPRGYVEPNVEFYSRMEKLIQAAIQDIKELGIERSNTGENALKLLTVTQRLKDISKKELQATVLSDDDYSYILNYGSEAEYLTAFFKGGVVPFYQGQVALVADVASDGVANGGGVGTYRHAGVGNVRTIYVEIPQGESKRITRGGVFSYYEFPISGKRLTDEEWSEMLLEKKNPPRPEWTDSFVAE